MRGVRAHIQQARDPSIRAAQGQTVSPGTRPRPARVRWPRNRRSVTAAERKRNAGLVRAGGGVVTGGETVRDRCYVSGPEPLEPPIIANTGPRAGGRAQDLSLPRGPRPPGGTRRPVRTGTSALIEWTSTRDCGAMLWAVVAADPSDWLSTVVDLEGPGQQRRGEAPTLTRWSTSRSGVVCLALAFTRCRASSRLGPSCAVPYPARRLAAWSASESRRSGPGVPPSPCRPAPGCSNRMAPWTRRCCWKRRSTSRPFQGRRPPATSPPPASR